MSWGASRAPSARAGRDRRCVCHQFGHPRHRVLWRAVPLLILRPSGLFRRSARARPRPDSPRGRPARRPRRAVQLSPRADARHPADVALAVGGRCSRGPRATSLATGAFLASAPMRARSPSRAPPGPSRCWRERRRLVAFFAGLDALRLRGPYFAVFAFRPRRAGQALRFIWYETSVRGTVGRRILAPPGPPRAVLHHRPHRRRRRRHRRPAPGARAGDWPWWASAPTRSGPRGFGSRTG